MRHLLEVDDLAAGELSEVLELAADTNPPRVLAGGGVGLIFEKPSTRTRNSAEMAVVALGGHPVSMRGDEVGLGVREPVEDVVRVLASYHRVVGARVYDHRVLEAMAAAGRVPVVNLLSDRGHPLQALADLLTLQQRWGSLAGHKLAWVGDANNVARSLTLACALVGVKVALASPAGFALDQATLERAKALGGEVSCFESPPKAVAGADAVCTDTWVSMGDEDQAEARLAAFGGFGVDSALMAQAAEGAVFLHCLPAHRGHEVTAEVIDGPASAVWDQAANRLHATRGLLQWLVRANGGPA